MKRIARVHVGIPPDTRKTWEDIISRYVGKAKWIEPLRRETGKTAIYCEMDMADPRYAAFLTLLQQRGMQYPDDTRAADYKERFEAVLHSKGVTWSIGPIDHIYTDAELRACPFVHVIIARAEIRAFGPKYDTTYDLASACRECGSGAVQTSPFYAPVKSMPKSGLVCRSSTEYFVAEPVVDAMRRAEVTGLELRQVLSSGEHKPLPWWQIIPKVTMPKVSPATKGLIQDESLPPCPLCRRDCHCHVFLEPEELAYSKTEVDPDALPDVVQTWERFGRSVINREDFKRSRFAEPAILIKPSVFDILRKLKVKQVFFTPVRVV